MDRHGLLRHAALLNKLRPCHMSGDEATVETGAGDSGTSGQAYHIIEAAWQSQEFKTCMRDLDVWNIRDFDANGSSGSRPRRRVALLEPHIVDSSAPVGLWRNCYNPSWLKTLDKPRRRLLRIIDEDFDFTLPKYKESIVDNTVDEFPAYEREEEGADGNDEGEGSSSEDEGQ